MDGFDDNYLIYCTIEQLEHLLNQKLDNIKYIRLRIMNLSCESDALGPCTYDINKRRIQQGVKSQIHSFNELLELELTVLNKIHIHLEKRFHHELNGETKEWSWFCPKKT
jgi:hypothetical protein